MRKIADKLNIIRAVFDEGEEGSLSNGRSENRNQQLNRKENLKAHQTPSHHRHVVNRLNPECIRKGVRNMMTLDKMQDITTRGWES